MAGVLEKSSKICSSLSPAAISVIKVSGPAIMQARLNGVVSAAQFKTCLPI